MREKIILLLNQAADRHGVDRRHVHAIARIESGHQHFRGGGVITSSAGALGVMQLMPGTARGLGVNPYDLHENIEGGVRYYRSRLNLAKGDPSTAVAMYYAGVGGVRERGAMNWPGVQRYIRNFNALIRSPEIARKAGLPAPTSLPAQTVKIKGVGETSRPSPAIPAFNSRLFFGIVVIVVIIFIIGGR